MISRLVGFLCLVLVVVGSVHMYCRMVLQSASLVGVLWNVVMVSELKLGGKICLCWYMYLRSVQLRRGHRRSGKSWMSWSLFGTRVCKATLGHRLDMILHRKRM